MMAEAKTEKKGGGEQTLSVALRIRPLNEDEILQGSTQIAYKVEDNVMVLMDPSDDPDDILRQNRSREKTFVFDYTFDSIAQQSDVYEATTKCLIKSVIDGYNATVFAYGATGAGKTYTMLGTDDDPGVMVRALNDLFLEMDRSTDDLIFKVSMSYLEIYNEMIRDLLNPSSGILDLREDARGGVQVAGLSEITTRSTREVMDMLTKGNKERTQEPTAANLTSSRSHAVLQVTVMQRSRIRNIMQEVRTGKLFLIDLAGSERAANTMNRGKRMVEGAHINRSLLALGNCINALSDRNGPKYINYRDSKLTRLLKDALGGNCKTVMIAHVSPASIHFEESRNTLVYADRAKHIKTKVRRNVTDVAYHIAQYTNIIAELREEVMRLRDKLQDSTAMTSRQSIASIQAVQTEVLDAKKNSHKEDVIRLREKLLNSFKDQMELRKSLMELNNASMEVSLETNRNQLIISSWEVEKTKMIRKREQDGLPVDNKLRDLEKATELSGDSSFQQTDEVRIARDELKVLHDEKHKTEKIRTTIQKELEMAKIKTRKLEESIPFKIGIEDHREILELLCKVHQLEMENMEVQSSCLLRDFQIKKKDMILTQYQHHRSLCDEIILQQRNVIDDNSIITPKELDELYDLYNIEKRNFADDESSATSPTTKSISTSSFPKLTLAPDQTHGRSDEKFFTPSAKLKHLKENETRHSNTENVSSSKTNNQSLNSMWRNDSFLNEKGGKFTPTSLASRAQSDDPQAPQYRETGYYGDHAHNAANRYRSSSPFPKASAISDIINKNNRSRTVSPVDRRKSPANVSVNSLDDKSEISTNTRGIAALAAKKKSKSKAQADAVNTERQRAVGRPLFRPVDESVQERENYLSPSRLEKHNRIYGESSKMYVPSEENHSYVDKRSALVDGNLPPIRSIPEESGLSQKDAELRRLRRNRGNDPEKQYSKKQSKKPSRNYQNDDVDSLPSRRYRHSNDKTSKAETFVKEDPRLNAVVPFDSHSFKNYHITDVDKKRKKRKNKGQPPPTASDSSTVSTPQNHRRPFPSIPAYRKAGDITITGVGVSGHNKY